MRHGRALKTCRASLVCLLLLAGGMLRPAAALHFVSYGDSQGDPAVHRQIVDRFATLDPELVIHNGDLWAGYPQEEFLSIITSHPAIADLVVNQGFLAAKGNHDDSLPMISFEPPIVLNDSLCYSFTRGNSFFVCAGMLAQVALPWIEVQLASAQAQKAVWRFVYFHFPVYSWGYHTSRGIPAFEELCDRYGVTMVFSGHDHHYESTFQLHDGAVADTGSTVDADNGTVYVVSGGGGGMMVASGANWWTRQNALQHHFCEILAGDTTLVMQVHALDGTIIDRLTIRARVEQAGENTYITPRNATAKTRLQNRIYRHFGLDGRVSPAPQAIRQTRMIAVPVP